LNTPSATRLLHLAFQKGFLPSEELNQLTREGSCEQDPAMVLRALVQRGILTEAQISTLMASFPSSAIDTPPPPRPSPPPLAPIYTQTQFKNWGHYRNLTFIGEGGMGRIFKAYDPSLQRPVALKILRGDSPELILRFLLEAQHQAAIEHANICRVYEVGEHEGHSYIAMQFIAGGSLEDQASTLSIVECVQVMATAAEAIHAAHRLGLIHRDIKPANILLEKNEQGQLKPYVLDFGLARGSDPSGFSVSGLVLGTTHYMAPEQARGENSRLSCRTDVYGLGATLYAILGGQAPFSDADGAICIQKTLAEEPIRLRALCPDLPKDLETIVEKCMEKDPSRRYDSAQQLAEDLRSFLVGEPIQARPQTLSYRAFRFARKNKGVLPLAAVALVTISILGGGILFSRIKASRQIRWAQQYGQEAERLEALVRYIYLMPAHDIRRELALVKARVEAQHQRAQALDGDVQAAALYALGRAYLTNRNFDLAKASLEKAWNQGLRTPDVAYALGKTLGFIYQRELEAAWHMADQASVSLRIAQLDRTLKAQVIYFLREGRGASLEPPTFMEAQLAYFEMRYDYALEMAKRAHQESPWLYEARALQAEIYLAQANTLQDSKAVIETHRKASTCLEDCLRIAPCDPHLLEMMSRRWWQELDWRRDHGMDTQEAFGAQLAVCDQWLRIIPEDPSALARQASAYVEIARRGAQNDVTFRFRMAEKGVRLAKAILDHDPASLDALLVSATGKTIMGFCQRELDQDPSASFDVALEFIGRYRDRDPWLPEANSALGAVLAGRLEWQHRSGQYDDTLWQRCLPILEEASRRYPQLSFVATQVGWCCTAVADSQMRRGQDPTAMLQKAQALLTQAITRDPSYFQAYEKRGLLHLLQARFQADQDQDPLPELQRARQDFYAALRIAHNDVNTLLELFIADNRAAEARLRRGQGAEEELRLAASTLGTLQKTQKQRSLRRLMLEADHLRLKAWSQPSQADFHLRQAQALVQSAIRIDPKNPEVHLAMARVYTTWDRCGAPGGDYSRLAEGAKRAAKHLNPLAAPTSALVQ